MADKIKKPVIFLAFANDRDDTVGYLRNLPPKHEIGQLESSAFGAIEDPTRHVELQTLQRTTEEEFRT